MEIVIDNHIFQKVWRYVVVRQWVNHNDLKIIWNQAKFLRTTRELKLEYW